MKESMYEAIISSNKIAAKELVNNCLIFINNNINNASPEDVQDLKLVLSELIYNAVIHGNNEDENKKVSVSVKIIENNVFVKISDEGDGFDYAGFLSRRDNLSSEALLMESGRGILLVMSLVDEISFDEVGNIIEFSKKVGSNG